MCRGCLHQLAGNPRRQDRHRSQCPVAQGPTLEPDWKIDGDGWVIQVDGQPTVTTKVGFLPPPYFEATTIEEFMDLRNIMTAVPAINAIPAVVAAAPGIATYADLPLTL